MENERSLVKNFKNLPVALVGINADEDRKETLKRFQEDGNTWRSFHVGRDWNAKLPREAQTNAIPRFWVLDQHGNVRAAGVGMAWDDMIGKAEELLDEMGFDVELFPQKGSEQDQISNSNEPRFNQLIIQSAVQSLMAREGLLDDTTLSSLNPHATAEDQISQSLHVVRILCEKLLDSPRILSLLHDGLHRINDANQLHDLGWLMSSLNEKGVTFSDDENRIIKQILEKAIRLSPKSSDILDSMARFCFHAEKDTREAIRWQEKALKHAKGHATEIETFLKQLREAEAQAR